jgi:hypothetical protein
LFFAFTLGKYDGVPPAKGLFSGPTFLEPEDKAGTGWGEGAVFAVIDFAVRPGI